MAFRPNDDIASRLDEIAALLEAQAANPFRVRAYRRAAATLRHLGVSAQQILSSEGTSGLDRLRGIGPSLARTIRDIVAHGYSPMLARLRGDSDAIHLLATVPGIGMRLAARLHDELGIETLPDLESAAHDGRLEDIAGFGPKRLSGIRDTLARRLARHEPSPHGTAAASRPDVRELLDVDREYRDKTGAGTLTLIAPRRFNPERKAWLPILHTVRGDRHYTALFSNTARAHRLHKTNDWVILYCDDGPIEHQWTIVTAEFGSMRGQRIVRGVEADCAALHRSDESGPAIPTDSQATAPHEA
jgi:putative hydrolase